MSTISTSELPCFEQITLALDAFDLKQASKPKHFRLMTKLDYLQIRRKCLAKDINAVSVKLFKLDQENDSTFPDKEKEKTNLLDYLNTYNEELLVLDQEIADFS